MIVDENSNIIIDPSFKIRDKNHALSLIKDISEIYDQLSILYTKGYINQTGINLPFVKELLLKFSLLKKPDSFVGSLSLNAHYYYFILLIMYRLLIMIDIWLENSGDFIGDYDFDLKTLKNNLFRMIHPSIKAKIRNKGITVILNATVGYDCEYDLKSSLSMTNNLLSIQLASHSHLYIKVPVTKFKPTNSIDLVITNLKGVWERNKMMTLCCSSIDSSIESIRKLLYEDNDKLLVNLIEELNTKSLTKIVKPDYYIYSTPKTAVNTMIKYLNKYTSDELIKDSESLKTFDLQRSLTSLILLLNKVSGNGGGISTKMQSSIDRCLNQPTSRISYKFNDSKSQLNITVNRVLYLCMHESTADLSMLHDFDQFKELLNIVARSFVTIGKPLTLDYSKSKVYIRDTILIAPAGAKSLAGIGDIYGSEFKKIDLGDYRKDRMSILLEENKELFEQYAIRDSEITLKHASTMEEFNYSLDKLGVPLTLSGIGKSYVMKEWSSINYGGYHIRSDIMVGNLVSKLTPKHARSIDLSRYIVQFISGFRGGRNESMMYGVDTISNNSHNWIDYDLTSAYTTVMSMLGHPDTDRAVRIFGKTVNGMSNNTLLFNYIILDVDFEFKTGTKYPCIPTRVDDNVDIYPLKGRSTITGVEYLVAKSMGCKLFVNDGVMIPFLRLDPKKEFTEHDLTTYMAPFKYIINNIQENRRRYPKKTFYNYMYKEIGNSIYGQVAMGLSGKTSFDLRTQNHIRIEGSALSNPILVAYVTGFIRALVGECLHNIDRLKGNVISATTDGFLTDLPDLENKIMSLEGNKNCIELYRSVRKKLTTHLKTTDDNQSVESFDESALEIKNVETAGIITWKTRGQLGYSVGGVSAATGFQTKFLDKDFLIKEWSDIMNDDNNNKKSFEYIQTSLRSATDVYKNGGHVIQKFKDRKYSLCYDNKRRILDRNTFVDHYKDQKHRLLDTLPWDSIDDYSRIRILNDLVSSPIYSGYSTQAQKSYKSYIETSVRGFIKSCLATDVDKRYGIPKDMFTSYKSMIDFIYGHEPARVVKLNSSIISNLKNRDSIARAIPRTSENESFVEYIKSTIKTFNSDLFFREYSPEVIRSRKKERDLSSVVRRKKGKDIDFSTELVHSLNKEIQSDAN